jgi:rhomboid protease GluP
MANFNYYKSKLRNLTLTEWLIGINLIMFALTQILNITVGNGLLRLGAKVNFLIGLGEYWRLLTSMFLHADLMHLIFNMLALYILGRDIERFFGKTKFLLIYFGSGLIGSAFSYLIVSNVSVGASGAIFGLMGANLFLYKINPTVYKRIYGSDFLILIGINLVLGIIRPNIDMAGHIGGLIGGFIIAFSLGLSYEKALTPKRVPFQVITILMLLVPISIASYTHLKSPESYASAAYYHYSINNRDTANKYIDRGIDKFPEIPDLILIKNSINQ